MSAGLVLVGGSHRRAPLAVRERLAIGPERAGELARALAGAAGEAVVLSTCARTELYVSSAAPAETEERAIEILRAVSRLRDEQLRPVLYRLRAEDAARHLFRVAAGLDSIVLGEGEILRQLRQAQALGAPGPLLGGLFRQALHTGKRVRSETRLAERPSSLPAAAAAAAAQTLGGVRGRRVLLLGAGRMSMLCGRALASRGARIAIVANRTAERAERLAREFRAEAVGLERLREVLPQVDAVVAATSAPGVVLAADEVRRAVRSRRRGRLCVIDLAVPRDVEPAAGQLEGCVLYTLDDLERFLRSSRTDLHQHLLQADRIVDEELARFRAWHASRAVAPTITALRTRAEEIRTSELARAERRLRGFTQTERELVESVTTQLVGKLLHLPTVRLKEAAGTADGVLYADAVRHLFAVGEEARS